MHSPGVMEGCQAGGDIGRHRRDFRPRVDWPTASFEVFPVQAFLAPANRERGRAQLNETALKPNDVGMADGCEHAHLAPSALKRHGGVWWS